MPLECSAMALHDNVCIPIAYDVRANSEIIHMVSPYHLFVYFVQATTQTYMMNDSAKHKFAI